MAKRSHGIRGFSLVELMIGITVGLFILLGASSLMVNQISDHRRLSLETRTEQDMRAIAELISRELRRAGGWSSASQSVWSELNPNPQPIAQGDVLITANGRSIEFSYARGDAPPVNKGFKLDGDTIRALDGGGWQPLSDPETLKVTAFNAALNITSLDAPTVCALPCDGALNCPPKIEVRTVSIQIAAQAAHDARVKRDITIQARLPSDRLVGACRAL